MKKVSYYIILFVGILLVVPLMAETIWKNKNLYSSSDILKVGDIVQVNITDISNMRFNLTLANESNSDITSNPDMTITGFLPKVSASKKTVNNENTQFSGRGDINLSVAARLTKQEGKGYQITGTRIYSFNGITTVFSVSGIIDPVMVQGRMINSSNVLDFRLIIRGSKQGAINIRREKLKTDEAANINLTEEEKQQIITDYLNKMINELTR